MTAKIALFIPSLMPGGVQRVMLNLSRGLAERGCQVDIVLAQAAGPFLERVPAGVRVVDLRAGRVLASLPALVRYLRSERPSSMLSAQPHCNLVAIWARTLARPGMRLVVSEHGYTTSALQNSRRLADRFLPFLMRRFYRRADAVAAVSRGTAEDLAARSGLPLERIAVVHNPVVAPEIEELARLPLAHPWFAAGAPPVLLAAGRMHPAKDYPTLLRAFADLRSRRAARLVILGDGKQRPELEALAASLGIAADVDMPGFADNPFAFMARCAALVLSSRWEGFGNVLVEAMACGAQVVSTDCPGGPAEILENGKYGRLAPVGDAPALAAAIESALDDPLPPEQIRTRARAFSIEAATEKYLRLLTGERDG
ncbi:MAG: group 1 glycosyl transferase [Anaerolineaceae bacterium]|nr:MAG: group 1 glycosyl transferase [Anaerolineaceae bacterium]